MSRLMIILALLALVAVSAPTGCSEAHPHSTAPAADLTGWPTGELVQVGVCDVTLPAGIDPVRRERILDAIAYIASSWEHDEGWLPPTSIGITDEEPECDGGGNFGGCWRGDRYVICNTAGDTCAYLYHEFSHRAYQLWGHSDPRWSNWNQRMQELWVVLDARPYPEGYVPGGSK